MVNVFNSIPRYKIIIQSNFQLYMKSTHELESFQVYIFISPLVIVVDAALRRGKNHDLKPRVWDRHLRPVHRHAGASRAGEKAQRRAKKPRGTSAPHRPHAARSLAQRGVATFRRAHSSALSALGAHSPRPRGTRCRADLSGSGRFGRWPHEDMLGAHARDLVQHVPAGGADVGIGQGQRRVHDRALFRYRLAADLVQRCYQVYIIYILLAEATNTGSRIRLKLWDRFLDVDIC